MRFNATKKQTQIFRLAAVAYEKLGDVTSKNLEALGCSSMQVDGRRGHVLYIAETLERENHCDMNAEHRIAARAALELHKRDAKSLEKKNEQLEFSTDEQEERVQAIEEFLSDIDEQLELQPETEEEAPLETLDEHIERTGDPSEEAPESIEDDTRERKPGDEWESGGRSFLMMRDGKIFEITNISDKERKNLRRAARRKSRAKVEKTVKTRKQAKRK